MSTTLYPSSLAELDRWRVENSTTLDEARNGNPRSTIDLDFTAGDAFSDEEEEIRTRLDVAIRIVVRRHGVKLKCQKVKRQPKSKAAALPTWQVCIGYQFPTDRHFADYE